MKKHARASAFVRSGELAGQSVGRERQPVVPRGRQRRLEITHNTACFTPAGANEAAQCRAIRVSQAVRWYWLGAVQLEYLKMETRSGGGLIGGAG